jgi:UDP:flavonoid glycosyltransferase YjiC (YdhE family)
MARFVFVSHPALGHLDFGGGGYLRTARQLIDRGHRVRWLLPANLRPGDAEPRRAADAEAAITAAGVPVVRLAGPFDLNAPLDAKMIEAVRALSHYIREEAADACIIDRLSVLASIAAHSAHIPWAVVGGDGAQWTAQAGRGVKHGVFVHSPVGEVARRLGVTDYPTESLSTFWGVSPLLNVSFFPRHFYGVEGGTHSHFVGGDTPVTNTVRDSLLVTLGTSYRPEVRDALLSSLVTLATQGRPRIEILTGDAAISARLRAASDRVRALDWEPYDTAFSRARLAIGHGGNAFLWQAVAAGVPVIAIPSGIGDQSFAAERVERLGLGRSIHPHTLSPQSLGAAIDDLLGDGATQARVADLQRSFRSGGGIVAAAELFERLARERSVASDCVAPMCCCREEGVGVRF